MSETGGKGPPGLQAPVQGLIFMDRKCRQELTGSQEQEGKVFYFFSFFLEGGERVLITHTDSSLRRDVW